MAVEGVGSVAVDIAWEASPQVTFKHLIPTIKHCVVIGSGKGGVGKSTVASNLAIALFKQGLKVGLMDADIYGPSIGMMFGITEGPEGTDDNKIKPIEKFGLKLMSMAFLVDEDRPIIWRGPMLNKALMQFLGDVLWGDLDVLIIDLPPGTGDIQISLIQNVDLPKTGGAIVVSTPQDIAFLDAKKAIGMFKTVQAPLLGIIENMSSFLCPACGAETQIFGHGGVKAAAERLEIPFLGEVPIDLAIREGGDSGTPLVEAHPDSPQAKVFIDMATKLRATLGI
jgi:ATP-binding protein involved in chromosome partitioning